MWLYHCDNDDDDFDYDDDGVLIIARTAHRGGWCAIFVILTILNSTDDDVILQNNPS